MVPAGIEPSYVDFALCSHIGQFFFFLFGVYKKNKYMHLSQIIMETVKKWRCGKPVSVLDSLFSIAGQSSWWCPLICSLKTTFLVLLLVFFFFFHPPNLNLLRIYLGTVWTPSAAAGEHISCIHSGAFLAVRWVGSSETLLCWCVQQVEHRYTYRKHTHRKQFFL